MLEEAGQPAPALHAAAWQQDGPTADALIRHGTPAYAVQDDLVAALEPAAPTPHRHGALDDAVALAWHLRQRDPARARALADDVDAALGSAAAASHASHAPDQAAAGAPPHPRADALRNRIALVRAELAWLQADLQGAERWAEQAAARCAAQGDAAGHSDAWSVLAFVALEQGDIAGAAGRMRRAHALATLAGDAQRVAWAEGALAYWAVIVDGAAAEVQWGPQVEHWAAAADPGLAMWAAEFRAKREHQRNQFAACIQHYLRVAGLALRVGQLRRAIIAWTNVCGAYTTLGAHSAALDAIDQGLALARPTGWPAPCGTCLYMMGNSLCHLRQFDSARRVMDEALTVLAPLAGSRLLDQASMYSGELSLAQGDHAAAAAAFAVLVAPRTPQRLPDIVCHAQRGLAEALLGLGRAADAATAAMAALQIAEGDGNDVSAFDALFVLARIQQRHVLPPPAGVAGNDVVLHYLTRAVECASRIEGFIIPPDVWDALAAEQARRCDMIAAYRSASQACASRDALQAEAATNLAIAVTTRHQTAREKAESERLREQAAAVARRAQWLQATNATLEELGAIGQEITSGLEIDGVFGSIYRHLGALLDAQHLGIWLLGNPPDRLHLRFGIEQGRRMDDADIGLDSAVSNAARCWREGREILHLTQADEVDGSHMPGTVRTLTALFGPLRVRERTIGVLSVQSQRADAYGQRERLIFRTVCAYSAVALDNASAYQQLDRARAQLAASGQAEREARRQAERAVEQKSEFLANISHDLRTPLASLHGYLETLLVKGGELGQADSERYLRTAINQSRQVGRLAGELLDLARLESGAVELSVECFPLAELAQDVFQKLELAANQRGHRLTEHVDANLPDVLADIGAIERVLTNLLDNAIQYAPPGSEVRIELHHAAGRVRVAVLDSGPGIPPAQRTSLFNVPSSVVRPHRPGRGGLGLLVVQRLLQQHGSDIEIVERPGYGAAFVFHLSCAGMAVDRCPNSPDDRMA